MDSATRAKREAEAIGMLDAATRLAETARGRRPLHDADPDWGELASIEDRTAVGYSDSSSADEQIELAWRLVEWADWLVAEGRGGAAYPFLRAAHALPKGPRDDPELVERLYRLAKTFDLTAEALKYRRQLAKVAPERLRATDSVRPEAAAKPAPLADDGERYSHPKFGVGTLVRREGSGLRVRFADGERVIVAERLTRIV